MAEIKNRKRNTKATSLNSSIKTGVKGQNDRTSSLESGEASKSSNRTDNLVDSLFHLYTTNNKTRSRFPSKKLVGMILSNSRIYANPTQATNQQKENKTNKTNFMPITSNQKVAPIEIKNERTNSTRRNLPLKSDISHNINKVKSHEIANSKEELVEKANKNDQMIEKKGRKGHNQIKPIKPSGMKNLSRKRT